MTQSELIICMMYSIKWWYFITMYNKLCIIYKGFYIWFVLFNDTWSQ